MLKIVALVEKREDLTWDEFVTYWDEEHVEEIERVSTLQRYTIAPAINPDDAPYDGIAELYFESLNDLHAALGSPGSRDYDPTREVAAKARQDVDNFLAIDERPRFIGEETVQRDDLASDGVERNSRGTRTPSGDTDGLYKHSAFLVRQDAKASTAVSRAASAAASSSAS